MGVAALPCLEGSWPLAPTLWLCFQCHLSCSVMQTPSCSSGNSWAHHIPVVGCGMFQHPSEGDCQARMCTWNIGPPVLQAFLHLAALPARVPCIVTRLRDWSRSLKDQCLDENLCFLLSLGIYLLRTPPYFIPADFANTCTFIKDPSYLT